MTQSIADYFTKHNSKFVEIAKRGLGDRYGEALSSYYMDLYKNGLPKYKNGFAHFYFFITNLRKPMSEINYIPKPLLNDLTGVDVSYDPMVKVELEIDLQDDKLVDFFMNNPYNDKWMCLYKTKENLSLDIFEDIIYEMVFIDGLSVREIAKLTNNSPSWVYQYRKRVIQKIKDGLNGTN